MITIFLETFFKLIHGRLDLRNSHNFSPRIDNDQTTGRQQDCQTQNMGKVKKLVSEPLGAINWVLTFVLPTQTRLTESYHYPIN